MGKTTDLFQKIRDTKGTFHAKMVGLGHSVHHITLTTEVRSENVISSESGRGKKFAFLVILR